MENKRGITLVIPNIATTIEDSAFYDCTGLTNIVIPDDDGNSVLTTAEKEYNYNGD